MEGDSPAIHQVGVLHLRDSWKVRYQVDLLIVVSRLNRRTVRVAGSVGNGRPNQRIVSRHHHNRETLGGATRRQAIVGHPYSKEVGSHLRPSWSPAKHAAGRVDGGVGRCASTQAE